MFVIVGPSTPRDEQRGILFPRDAEIIAEHERELSILRCILKGEIVADQQDAILEESQQMKLKQLERMRLLRQGHADLLQVSIHNSLTNIESWARGGRECRIAPVHVDVDSPVLECHRQCYSTSEGAFDVQSACR